MLRRLALGIIAGILMGCFIGYECAKRHFIFDTEVYPDEDCIVLVVDGEAHKYGIE